MSNEDIQSLIGMPIAEFINQFAGAENPIDDATNHLLHKLQEDGTCTKGFVAQARKYLVEAKEADKAKTILMPFIHEVRRPIATPMD